MSFKPNSPKFFLSHNRNGILTQSFPLLNKNNNHFSKHDDIHSSPLLKTNVGFKKYNPMSKMLFDLDEWDKKHVKEPSKKERNQKFQRRMTQLFTQHLVGTLNYTNKIEKDKKILASRKSIKSIDNFLNKIEDEKSALIAHNRIRRKQTFNFDIFKEKLKDKPFALSDKEDNEKEENKKEENKKEEKINDRDYYKGVVHSKFQIEKFHHDQITKIINSIKNLNDKLEKQTDKLTSLIGNCEKAKTRYLFCKDEYEKMLTRSNDTHTSHKNQQDGFEKTAKSHAKISEMRKKLAEAKNEYELIQEEHKDDIVSVQENIKNLKFNLKCKEKLRQKAVSETRSYYYNILKEGIDVRENGLSWVVFKLLELDSEIRIEHFPKYIDNSSFKYIMEYAQKILLIAKLKALIVYIRKTFVKEIKLNSNSEDLNKLTLPDVNKNITKEHILEIIREFDRKVKDKNLVLTNETELADIESTKKALEFIKHYSQGKGIERKDLFDCENNKFELLINNSAVSKKAVFNSMVRIREEINKIEKEITLMKKEQVFILKKKYDGMKSKGVNDGVKYDLMYAALFGIQSVI